MNRLPRSVCDHKLWRKLAKFVVVEKPRRRGETHKPSARIELHPQIPVRLRNAALKMKVGCCRCGLPIAPFRARAKNGDRMEIVRHIYCAVACPFPRLGCSRSSLASSAVERIEREVKSGRRRR